MNVVAKAQKNGTALLTIASAPGAPPQVAFTVTFRPTRPQGHPERYEGLPRFGIPGLREAAKVAIRRALAN